jgi:hypothetical protein
MKTTGFVMYDNGGTSTICKCLNESCPSAASIDYDRTPINSTFNGKWFGDITPVKSKLSANIYATESNNDHALIAEGGSNETTTVRPT